MSNNKSTHTNDRLADTSLKKLYGKFRTCDKSVLVSIVTACIFILFGLIQVISVILSPLFRTFDHVSLIIVDFIIAAFCVVFTLYRSSKISVPVLDSILKEDEDAAANGSGVSRIAIPSSSMHGISHSVRSAGVKESDRIKSGIEAENENLFSPRHRYSDSAKTRRTVSTRKSAPESSNFNSRHTGI